MHILYRSIRHILQCNGKAIGSGSAGADSSLQEQYNKDLTLKEAETIALSILKQVMKEKISIKYAAALNSELEAKKLPANVHIAMRYWHPFTEEAAQQIKKDGITMLVVLPLYPQFSISTTGSSIRALQNIFR
uniref:Uncharacterized protein n=1 Tax=Lactuca sativa TaxID=4236 RepID=A0A9R1V1F9_LACSA|nr:hypothetical protein LSAT_V11C700367140 [Lactuca sativa]